MELAGNIVGFVGVGCFLFGYFMLQRNAWPHHELKYLGINLVGAILVMASLLIDWNLPAFLLEAAWALISMYGIYKHLYRRKNT
jgi:hypothetical protein